MATNKGQICRDLFGQNLHIKGKTVIDSKRDLTARNANINKLCVRKNLKVEGLITTLKRKPLIFPDFNSSTGIAKELIKITEPGYYELQHNVIIDYSVPGPNIPEDVVIEILSDNVVIDLCGLAVEQLSTNTLPLGFIRIGQIPGTDLSEVYDNITIKNGTLKYFKGIPISGINLTSIVNVSGLPTPWTNIKLHDLCLIDIDSTGFPGGFLFEGSGDFPDPHTVAPGFMFQNFEILRCKFIRCNTLNVILYVADQVHIEDVEIRDMVTSGTFAEAAPPVLFDMDGCNEAYVENVMIRNIVVPTNDFGFVLGAYIGSSSNSSFNNFQIKNVITPSEGFGFLAPTMFNCTMFNCGTENMDYRGRIGLGIGILCSLSKNLKCVECNFNGCISDINATGIFLAAGGDIRGDNILFKNCESSNHICPEAGYANGLLSHEQDFLTIDGLTIKNVHTTGGITRGIQIYGFDNAPTGSDKLTNDILVKNCSIKDISGGTARGIHLSAEILETIPADDLSGGLKRVTVENCTVEDIESTVASGLWDNILVSAGIEITSKRGGENPPYVVESFGGGPNNGYRDPRPPSQNVENITVRNCFVKNVTSNGPYDYSAGIIVNGVEKGLVCENKVMCCERGYLLSGDNTLCPNGFQLATSFANATSSPPVFIDLTTGPGLPSTLQNFTNTDKGNSLATLDTNTDVNPFGDQLYESSNFILPSQDLNTLGGGWETGDAIVYDQNGSTVPIGGLTDSTTYYAVMYTQGYTGNTVVWDNKALKCDISGFEDNAPTTFADWIDNHALACPLSFDITWPGSAPVESGNLFVFPDNTLNVDQQGYLNIC